MPDPSPHFFTLEEAIATEALVERIFPATAEGPGATDAHVAVYIDRRLASPWGNGDRMYRSEPFLEPEHAGHGWQSPLTPNETFRSGLSALEHYAAGHFDSRRISELSDVELDELLVALSNDSIDTFKDPTGKQFFKILISMVNEGLFSDPMYGGNYNMIGWRWIGFPGDPDAYGDPYKVRFGKPESYAVEPKGIRA